MFKENMKKKAKEAESSTNEQRCPICEKPTE